MQARRRTAALAVAVLAGLLLPAAPAVAAPPPEPGVSLLLNAGFDKDEAVTGWTLNEPGTNWAIMSSGAHDGANYLRANTGTAAAGSSFFQDVPVATTAGQSFTGSIWVRSDSGTDGAGTLALWGLGGGGTETRSTNFTATPQWQQVQVPLDTAVPHSSLRLQVYLHAGIQYAFDGAELASQLVTNASFERGTAPVGWSQNEPGTNWAVMTSGAHDGAAYLRANLGTAAAGASFVQDSATATTAGQAFTGSIWVRSDSGTNGAGTLALWGLGGGGTEGRSTNFTATPQWQQVQVPLDTTVAHTSLRMQLYLHSGIQYAFDGAELTPQGISNASFEAGTSPTGWVRNEAGTNWAVMTSGSHDGAAYLRANLGTAAAGSSFYQDVARATTAGQSFTGSIWVRADSGTEGAGTLGLWGLGGGGTEGRSTNFTATPQWQQVQVPLDTNFDHTVVRLQLYLHAGIQYAFDGAQLTSAPRPPVTPPPAPAPQPSCAAVTGPVPVSHTTVVGGVRVHACLAAPLTALIQDASAAGINLSGWGYRTTAQQIALRIEHCGGNTPYNVYEKPSSQCSPPTAQPGTSMHERGLAIDFTQDGGDLKDSGFAWLAAHAAGYGLKNFPKERWHWSTNGS
ncbi:M15 family metallopeptidase [Cellulomonas sp. NPDC058312]|uniref:M15 family metallopeptidase n=1 Tax=Cellulomonas sp. NPDC058312 TaxID=3346441 RepID=UPI0036E1759C